MVQQFQVAHPPGRVGRDLLKHPFQAPDEVLGVRPGKQVRAVDDTRGHPGWRAVRRPVFDQADPQVGFGPFTLRQAALGGNFEPGQLESLLVGVVHGREQYLDRGGASPGNARG